MSRKAIRNITLLAVFAILIFLVLNQQGVFDFGSDAPSGSETESASPEEAPEALPVRGHVVKAELLTNSLSVTGTVFPDEEVEVTSEVSGIVESISFREGRPVSKGQLLVKINDEELQARLKKVEYQIELARQLEARKKKLLEIGGISQEEYDQSLTEYNTLVTEAELFKVQIEKTEIRAPFNGVIGLRQISAGSYITPGTRIATLLKTDRVKVEFAVPEKYANLVPDNASISFTIEGVKLPFEGRIYAREPLIDLNTRTLVLKAISANPKGLLIPGAFANVNIVLGEYDNALLVPTQALVPEQGGQKVFLMKGGKATPSHVETGIRQADDIQILSGIAAGDTVITSGLLQVRPDLAVEITELE